MLKNTFISSAIKNFQKAYRYCLYKPDVLFTKNVILLIHFTLCNLVMYFFITKILIYFKLILFC